jgi:transcriptional regulator with XRE-family HTH domain
MAAFTLSVYGDAEALRALGEALRGERLRSNLTQSKIANLAGISLPTLRKIERGDGTVEIRHYARVLGILGHVERLGQLVPISAPPPDPKFLAAPERQRARDRKGGRT